MDTPGAKAKTSRSWAWLGLWLGVSALFALAAWRGMLWGWRADSNGYEAAAFLLTSGERPHADFLHSQGALFLRWGNLWHWLTGGWGHAFRLSACVSFVLAAGVACRLLAQKGAGGGRAFMLAVGFLLCPVVAWQGWFFIGLSETLLGLCVALWGLLGQDKPNALWVGLGLGLALSNRLLALPVAAVVLLALLLENPRAALAALLVMALAWLGLMSLGLGAADNQNWGLWWRQAVLYHQNKQIVFPHRWRVVGLGVLWLVPLALAWATQGRPVAPRRAWLFGAGALLGVALAAAQPIFTPYYLLPTAVCLLAGLLNTRPAAGWRRWGLLPAFLAGCWPVAQVFLPPHPHIYFPQGRAVCDVLKHRLPPGAPVLAESTLAWDVLRCGPFPQWRGLTDTNLFVFQSLVAINTVTQNLVTDPPAAVVLEKGTGLHTLPQVRRVLGRHYHRLPMKKSLGNVVIYVPR